MHIDIQNGEVVITDVNNVLDVETLKFTRNDSIHTITIMEVDHSLILKGDLLKLPINLGYISLKFIRGAVDIQCKHPDGFIWELGPAPPKRLIFKDKSKNISMLITNVMAFNVIPDDVEVVLTIDSSCKFKEDDLNKLVHKQIVKLTAQFPVHTDWVNVADVLLNIKTLKHVTNNNSLYVSKQASDQAGQVIQTINKYLQMPHNLSNHFKCKKEVQHILSGND